VGIVRWLDSHFEELLIGVFSLIMTVVIAIQIFMRYVMDNSLSWSEELARYCFIWLVYLGISLAVKKQRHMSVDVMFLVLKGKAKIVLSMIANLLFLSFSSFAIFYGFQISMKLLTWGQVSPALDIPIGLVYLATPVGMGLTAIRLIQQLILQAKSLAKNEAAL
jgi:TRAP-type C4-dicarboxylate transport system permease small subunit